MSNSSQQTDYLIISGEDLYSSSADNTITITGDGTGGSYILSNGDTITLSNLNTYPIDSSMNHSGAAGSVSSIDIGNITITDGYSNIFAPTETTEWVDSFPDWYRIQDMCKKYPGMEIALRNFRTIYTLVKDDYDNAKDQE